MIFSNFKYIVKTIKIYEFIYTIVLEIVFYTI